MNQSGNKQRVLASGWILVTGVLLLCIAGTGLTWWNYSQHVFSSGRGVMQSEGGARMVVVNDYPKFAATVIEPGHLARITVGSGNQMIVLQGVVASVSPETLIVSIRILDHDAPCAKFADGTLCGVTIDTTVPPMQGNR